VALVVQALSEPRIVGRNVLINGESVLYLKLETELCLPCKWARNAFAVILNLLF
jgi:hypothetical protein